MEELLGSLGLSKYLHLFEEAEIDLQALSLCSDDDLKELGLPIGPRLKLRQTIAQLNARSGLCEATGTDRAGLDRSEITPAGHEVHGERRQISVMFVDMVSFTGLTSELDPEDMGKVVDRYQGIVAQTVSEFGGQIAKYMGDGVLSYFGWPQAHEDDAERAVRAAVAIVERVKALQVPEAEAGCRVGIATGVVVIGSNTVDKAMEMDDIFGETPALAARLQALAKRNTVVVSRTTRNLIGEFFAFAPLGSHEIKGYSDPVEIFEVGAEGNRVTRYDARNKHAPDVMIGRGHERQEVLARWNEAAEGSGQFLLVTGEAGIGKSRLVNEVSREVERTEHARVTCQCSPFHTRSALHPIIVALKRAADLDPGEDPSVWLEKVECVAGLSPQDVPFIAKLLDIDTHDRYPPLELSPNQFRTQLFQALVRLFVAQSRETPFLFIFEDLHWIDPTSLELLDVLLDSLSDYPILVLATARPNFQYGFGGHPTVRRLSLNRLGRAQISEMVREITEGLIFPEAVLNLIVERTDGVPLFVQELTKAILESSSTRVRDRHMVLEGDLDTSAIPTTLHDSLMARLDRQINVKEAAQLAACIGREFEHDLLFSISTLEESKLTAALDGLIDAELVYRRGVPPDASYVFKHALVRDAAYDSLLRKRRHVLHKRILSVLETRTDIAPELLAHHAEAAGLNDRAIELWDSASQLALARPAFDEAISHLDRALSLAEADLENAGKAELERALKLRVSRGVALLARRGYGSSESQENYQDALRLADRIEATPLRFPILYGLWVGEYTRAEYHAGLKSAKAIVDLAEQSGESAPRQVAWKLHGLTLCLLGRNLEAEPVLDRSLELFDPVAHDGAEARFGQDLAATSYCYIMINSLLLGHTARAERHAEHALERTRIAQHATTTCYVHTHLTFKAMFLRDRAAFQKHAAGNASLALEHNLGLWRYYVDLFEGLEHIVVKGAPGVSLYLKADRKFTDARNRVFLSLIRLEAAWRSLEAGLVEEAARLAAMTRELVAEVDEAVIVAELCRLEARLASVAGDTARADRMLNAAIAEADAKSHKLFHLRGAIDRVALHRGGAGEKNAAQELRSILSGIGPDDCLTERAIARSLLDTVSQ